MSEIRAVLFDFGGVLAEEGFSNGFEALAMEQQLAVEDMTEDGMTVVYDSGYVLGKASGAEIWSLLRERTGVCGSDAEFRARMFDGFVMRPWILALVDRLKGRGFLSDQTNPHIA